MSNWAAIGALGTAAEGAGNYFGIIAKEKIVSERLAEARANKLADVKEGREFDEGERVKQAARDVVLTADAVKADDVRRGKIIGEGRTEGLYNDEQEVIQDGKTWSGKTHTDEVTGVVSNVMNDGSLSETDRVELTPLQLRWKQLEQDAKAEEQWDEGGDMTEGQRQLAMRSAAGDMNLNKVTDLLLGGDGTGGEGDPYDPNTWNALIGRLASYNPATRKVFTRAEDSLYKSATGTLVASILRTDTGAAAPTAEQIEYAQRLIPQFGESNEVVSWKLRNLKSQFAAMGEASKADSTSESIRQASIDADRAFREQNPTPEGIPEQVDLTPVEGGVPVGEDGKGGVRANDGSSRAGYSSTPMDEEDAYMKSLELK